MQKIYKKSGMMLWSFREVYEPILMLSRKIKSNVPYKFKLITNVI
jgi:hypothetical protein